MPEVITLSAVDRLILPGGPAMLYVGNIEPLFAEQPSQPFEQPRSLISSAAGHLIEVVIDTDSAKRFEMASIITQGTENDHDQSIRIGPPKRTVIERSWAETDKSYIDRIYYPDGSSALHQLIYTGADNFIFTRQSTDQTVEFHGYFHNGETDPSPRWHIETTVGDMTYRNKAVFDSDGKLNENRIHRIVNGNEFLELTHFTYDEVGQLAHVSRLLRISSQPPMQVDTNRSPDNGLVRSIAYTGKSPQPEHILWTEDRSYDKSGALLQILGIRYPVGRRSVNSRLTTINYAS